jgi:hypothetical protein
MKNTVLGLRCGTDNFVHVVARYVREEEQKTREAMNGPYGSSFSERRAQALQGLAGLLESLDIEDQRALCLERIQGVFGGSTDSFNPTETQGRFFAGVGLYGDPPNDRDLLDELIAVGVNDFPDRLAAEFRKLDGANQRAEQLEPYRQKADELEAELGEARSEVARANDAERKTAAERDYLRDQLESVSQQGNGKPPAKSGKQPRRKAVEGHQGVYSREGATGTVYEIGWTGADGRQRWETIGPSLAEAAAEREGRTKEAATIKAETAKLETMGA